MKKTLLIIFLLAVIGIPRISHSHYSQEQYRLAEEGLEKITPKLTGHINTLDYIATDLRNLVSALPDGLPACNSLFALEIIEHHSMRAWYNRLLLQNISSIKDAVNLGQISTILKLSKEPLSNGTHRLNVICGQTKEGKQLRLFENARDTMYAMITVYDEAIAAIKTAMSEGRSSP